MSCWKRHDYRPRRDVCVKPIRSCTYKVHGSAGVFISSQVPLCITRQVTIQGAGADVTFIDGNQEGRVVFISAEAIVQINAVSIRKGDLKRANGFTFNAVSGGGGINNQGTLTLSGSAVTNNQADYGGGGGIYNMGILTVLHSTISGNRQVGNLGDGGGIYNYPPTATVVIADSTISNNTAGINGGGLSIFGGTVTLTNSLLAGNTALAGSGGGVVALGSVGARVTLTVTNSTISGNQSDLQGGGIYNHFNADTNLRNVTVTNNVSKGSGGGIQNTAGRVNLLNSIIAGNRAVSFGQDCFGFAPQGSALTSQGYNLIQNTIGCDLSGDMTGNILGQDARLGLLADNAGGSTKTHALSENSPAIDAGNPALPGSGGQACAVTDQRGFLRPLGAGM